ncbi:LysR family transcriptional regulator [Rhodospirillaceae bacterium SYSU D60014]|uniref:LysR family transcriptional regulator n=1 Tax=Virgifigura deserti TaxID=2268457 RepID=UPI000E66BE26
MNWEDLRLLDAAARTGSQSAAARLLGMSQPKLSRRLRALEETVGARLFDRLPQGLVPTPAGERLIPLVAEMSVAAEAVSRAKPALTQQLGGTVRISVDEVLARFLTDYLDELLDAAPGVEIELLADHVFANLSRREADLLIRQCLPEGGSVISKRLGDIGYAVYGARAYVDRRPAAWTDDRYYDCDWVGFAEERLWFGPQKRWLDERLARPPRVRTNQATVALDAVRAGSGLAVLPCFMADDLPELVRLTDPITALTGREYLLIHRDVLREPAVRTVTDALTAVFARQRRRLAGEPPGMAGVAE